jgi:hypothetical protein
LGTGVNSSTFRQLCTPVFSNHLSNQIASIMKKTVTSFFASALLFTGLNAQIASTSVEIVKVHDGIEMPDLAGYVTYRVFLNTQHENDFVSAIYGNTAVSPGAQATEPMGLKIISGELYRSDYGGYFPVSCAMGDAFPEVKYDSFFTIGSDCIASASEAVMTVQSIPSDFFTSFESGTPIMVQEGGFFTVQSFDNGWSGESKKVLIGQFTTNGAWEYCFSAQGQKLGIPGTEHTFHSLDICVNSSQALFTPEVQSAGGPVFSVYPNPTRDIFFLETSVEAHVSVFDLLGNEISYKFIPGSGRFEFNLNGQADGMYLVVIRTAEESLTKRVVKH